ncbi:unnamed protein product [Rhizopus microsporus]
MSGFFRNSQYNPQGFAPPPQTPYYSSYPPQQHTPLQRSHTLSANDRREQYLWNLFQRVDTDRSGSISVHELQQALVNGDWSPFNIETVRMMVNIFDTDNNGTIDFREFKGLWKYVEDWSQCFKTFDRDNSGSIDRYEMGYALRTFGFNVSDHFVNMLVHSFDKYGKTNPLLASTIIYQTLIGNGEITFDNFVQACVTLSTLTNLFRSRDYENRGSITINYEDVSILF